MFNIYKTHQVEDSPRLLEIEPAKGCNLRCIMCHVPHEKGGPEYIDIDKLRKSTEGITDCHVIIGSEYEPTIHPHFEDLLKLAIDRNWKVDFLTNGLRLDKIDKKILSDVNFHVFNISFDGATEDTFSKIRIGASYSKVLDNILNTFEIVRKNKSYIAVNATLLSSNLHEGLEMVKMWDGFHVDLIRLFVMQARDPGENILNESLYNKRDELVLTLNKIANYLEKEQLQIGVRNGYFGSKDFVVPENLNVKSSTIYSNNSKYRPVPGVRQDFQLGKWPGMNWPCKSPFVYCRIRWDGSVDLCNNRSFVVGNIFDKPLLKIWNDRKTNKVRSQIKNKSEICEKCDYFRFCLDSRSQDILLKESHFAGGLLEHPNIVNL